MYSVAISILCLACFSTLLWYRWFSPASRPSNPPQKNHEGKQTKQPYEAFLVLDVEGTCQQGTDFDYPNEIIEFPVFLMRWKDRTESNHCSQLEVVDVFHTYVRPTWRPTLSEFCTELTGVTQSLVEEAPPFAHVLDSCSRFLVKHGLIDATGKPLLPFAWCSDGPWDIAHFVVKQCFISRVRMPDWMQGDVVDVRKLVMIWKASQKYQPGRRRKPASVQFVPSLNIIGQLKALGLSEFEGRQHSGIDDTRNIARVLSALAHKGVRLEPNTKVNIHRRWPWMGNDGEILGFEYT
ncbi:ribonuclease H-like domain-containing protein [Mycena floridula]|nr:ribonuclease H-like domain-containing protein [Mycena floridula]